MNLLVGILPAILWGICPLASTKIGGEPINQLVGACYGQALVGLIAYLIFRPTITSADWFWCFLGGFAWSIAQLMQFMSFNALNVSRAMPISTGLQLIEVPLIGVIFWGNWGTPLEKVIGFSALLLLIIGISMTSVQDHNQLDKHLNYKSGLFLLIFGSFGYVASSVFPRIPGASGIAGTFPESIGMFSAGLVIGAYLQSKHRQPIILKPVTFENIVYGLFGCVGNIFYITSLELNGVSNAYTLTQLNVVVSTLGGIFLLHERKDKREFIYTMLGLVLVLIAAVMIAKIS